MDYFGQKSKNYSFSTPIVGESLKWKKYYFGQLGDKPTVIAPPSDKSSQFVEKIKELEAELYYGQQRN